MANGFEEVRPGDIISSDFWNRIIGAINEMEVKLQGIDSLLPGPGKVAVPNLFGFSLGIAKTELMKPQYGLLPGDIFNTGGQRIFPDNSAALELAVLNQTPEAGRIVAVGSRVGLVIGQPAAAAPPGGGTGTTPTHTVTGMNPGMPTGARIDQEIHVLGTNFVTPYNHQRVFFDGVHEAAVKGGFGTTDLLVDVPNTIPDVPRNVQVAVQLQGVTRVLPFLYLINPKSSTPELKVLSTNADGTSIRQGANLVITGTGFATTAAQNEVKFLLKLNPMNPALSQVVNATNISGSGPERTLTVPVPNPFTRASGATFDEMQPDDAGTQYVVQIHLAGTPAESVASKDVRIKPPLT